MSVEVKIHYIYWDRKVVDRHVMLASTVSSKLLRSIANIEGFKFEETLTGFKWIGKSALKCISEGYVVLFAFEEAIGKRTP